jgi:hypothetical protein
MTLTTTAQEITASIKVLPPATKYRIKVRFIAVDNGWEFEQIAPNVDRFTKGNARVDVTHGSRDLIVHAERAVGNSVASAGKQGKMFTVQAWLTGVADPIDPKTGKGRNFIRLSVEETAKLESGQGLAKIDLGSHSVEPGESMPKITKAEANREVKAAIKVTKVENAPKPKPAPRAAKTAPAVKA